ncbi:hypothetical protein EDC01DRAFT_201192 [Geopyxis carbonaria]|nr:hypothetical protein EDC01DRAFT_201192 [Geopyxis carbonaria]
MVYSLKNRNILITGGSRGLGAATAEKFAAEGANIVVNYVSAADRAAALVELLQTKYGVKAVAIQADVSTESACQRLVAESLTALGGLDIIISNAGWTRISPTFSSLTSVSTDDWDLMYAINVKATAHLLAAASATFNANPDGGVVLITSSTAATNAAGSSIAYAVSKAAGLHLMRCLAASQGPKVRVSAVLPGLLLTEWGMEFPAEKREAATRKAVLGKLPTVEDCADVFVTLAKADTVTGAAVKVDGGMFEA